MKLNLKVILVASALLLSACAGTNPSACYTENCRALDAGNTSQATGGTHLGSNFSQYSYGLMHD
ncbi:MAG: hypothetical protein PW845_13965 [Pseudomonas sp.]|uniref:hypothetical protein n=1 Tax=Pseudomonas abieticivorans TaxID=2931382 RepID=UPI0020BDBDD2|nr:hypothetical protein [Pseudomonas sp. PIA16]MDE1166450.1 hypothetical protein [Pseudomonas sp.]